MGQHYKVAIVSQVSTDPELTFDVARTKKLQQPSNQLDLVIVIVLARIEQGD